MVIKGVTDEKVLIGDPSLGIKIMPRSELEAMWNGLLFLIRNKKQVANQHFNKNAEWNFVTKAPAGPALRNKELANVTWLLPPSSDF